MGKIATSRQVTRLYNRMIETLEANLEARKAAEAQKTEQATETSVVQPVPAYDGSAGEASL